MQDFVHREVDRLIAGLFHEARSTLVRRTIFGRNGSEKTNLSSRYGAGLHLPFSIRPKTFCEGSLASCNRHSGSGLPLSPSYPPSRLLCNPQHRLVRLQGTDLLQLFPSLARANPSFPRSNLFPTPSLEPKAGIPDEPHSTPLEPHWLTSYRRPPMTCSPGPSPRVNAHTSSPAFLVTTQNDRADSRLPPSSPKMDSLFASERWREDGRKTRSNVIRLCFPAIIPSGEVGGREMLAAGSQPGQGRKGATP
jgi:hypothetical protein